MSSLSEQDMARVDRYVRGEMDEAEAAEFEELFLDRPDLIEQIELAQLLAEGAEQIEDTVPADPPATKSGGADWMGFLFGPRAGPVWAGACLMLLTLSVVQQNRFEDRLREMREPQANTPRLVLGTVRGGADDAVVGEISLSPGGGWFNLELELDWVEHEAYGLTIQASSQPDSHPGALVELDGLVPSAADTLAVTLPSDRFASGDYEVAISAEDREIARYRFRVTALR